MSKPLSDQLEYAILDHVMQSSERYRQHLLVEWETQLRTAVTVSFQPHDVESAFKRLRVEGVLRLSKPDSGRRHGVDYSGNDEDDEGFFYTDPPFNATITAMGVKYWEHLKSARRNGVFISHITEEKPLALVLQKYVRLAFGDDFRVFVSSDAKSIGGGKKWYTHIIENLRASEVVLVLVSQESKGREWITFEAGFGEGSESLVVPISVKNMSFGQLSYPLAGIQGRSVDDIGVILDDIGNRIGVPPATVDAVAYLAELEDAEQHMVYKSLNIEPVVESRNSLMFDIHNAGNVDIELLMLQVCLPNDVAGDVDHSVTRTSIVTRNGLPYKLCVWCSARGIYGGIGATLPSIITSSMGKIRPPFGVGIRTNLTPAQKQLSIFFQIHAIGYRTQEEERKISEVPSWI